MQITIHRGIDQIGGCITEIQSKSGQKILIDLGHNLPKGDENADDKLDNQEHLEDLLQGVSDIFYSHYHGDHIGFEGRVAATITQHMGELATKMVKVLKEHMAKAPELKEEAENSLIALANFKSFSAKDRIICGDITVIPLPVNHSALDSYMFLILCDGHTVLHTGDFRDHSYGAKEKLDDIERYLQSPVDILITEGTMLSRADVRMKSEEELQQEIIDKTGKYSFVLCSSMDIDRLLTFYFARINKNSKIRAIADSYQTKMIQTVKPYLAPPYNNLFAYPYGRDMNDEFKRMKCYGFMMLVRNSSSFKERIDEVFRQTGISPSEVTFVYSQFGGYINPRHIAYKKSLSDFVYLRDWKVEHIHTSGHASIEALEKVIDIAKPKMGIIPIHKEGKGTFQKINIKTSCPIIEETCKVGDIKIIVK